MNSKLKAKNDNHIDLLMNAKIKKFEYMVNLGKLVSESLLNMDELNGKIDGLEKRIKELEEIK